jgi:SAM-dependent methyltransferase
MAREAPSTQANREAWDSYAEEYQAEWHGSLDDDVFWGPGVASERKLRLLGDVRGRDVLELGCGGGQASVFLAAHGARASALDVAPRQLEHGRALARERGVEVRFLQGSAEHLEAFADGSFDVVFSSYALGFVEDLAGAMREVHRVLRPGGLFVFSWSGPIHLSTGLAQDGTVFFDRAYFDRAPHAETDRHGTVVSFHRTYGDWHRALVDAGFFVTDLLEPEPDPEAKPGAWQGVFPPAKLRQVPCTVVFRARKPRALDV